MAKEHRPEKSLHDLRQEIAHSRDRLGRDLGGLGYELNFPLKFKKSFQRNSKTWGVAALLLGVVLSIRSGGGRRKVTIASGGAHGEKKKGEEHKKGLLGGALVMGGLRFAATMLRPMVVSYVTKRMGGYAGRVR
jgi:hypothetical protein